MDILTTTDFRADLEVTLQLARERCASVPEYEIYQRILMELETMGEWTALATICACAATLVLLFWIWRGRWQPDPQKLIALIFATLLVSPHCHWHDYVLIGLVFALLVPVVKDSSTMWLIAATVALASWASLWLPNNFSAAHAIAVASLLLIGLIAIRTGSTQLRYHYSTRYAPRGLDAQTSSQSA